MILKDLSVTLDAVKIIDRLSFKAERGAWAVMAPSGAGKTTLLRAIAGLIPYEGKVEGAGKVTLLFQDDRLFPWLTALDNAALFCRDREKATGLLDKLGLGKYADMLPCKLSGGMQRRVSIAAWLSVDGDTLLMDEPTRGLDDACAHSVMALAREHARGKLLLFTTHSSDIAARFADGIITL